MIKELIQQLAQTGDEVYAKICEVLSVDSENKTADLKPLDGGSEINDVYLIVDDEKGGVYAEPSVGSLVCVVFVSKEIAVVVNASELKEFRVNIEETELRVDKDGFLLRKENETLKALMVDLIQEIKKMKFTTNAGPTIKLINKPQFTAIENRFKNFLKDN
ncbi:hypothetical protein OKE68_04285 [Riemerella anatipestifer]|uniref:Uncharacterized protein n=1 Tax=Riemerella anatipestifer TaxID=34085 RepID=A0AAP3AN38_RIEAN|nr:hypothetical protein [Riemerella anatipestifer]MCU7567991.1 hypothetical protein [Riemerella anatipestifer]MCW0490012.1 hypothetical protein [Riemerella anatipestifer]MCW0510715.1 hypothetical protein [Riemerella anatipestifer]MCW0519309.1 hypothetical protein [Riemerella anatipestifer]MCW0523534.1 hypothetical protein [Riemerella anatipestifer]